MKRSWLKLNLLAYMALAMITGGVLFLGIPRMVAFLTVQQGNIHNTATAASYRHSLTQEEPILKDPIHLSVPRLALEKDILPGMYDRRTQTWTLDQKHTFFMQGSATPLIYGHATENIFSKLDGVAKDEILKITTAQAKEYVFAYTHDEIVNYADGSFLAKRYANSILLMTCINETQRRVLHFSLLEEQTLAGKAKS